MKNKLLIIDGNSLVNRAYYALPYLTNSKGQFTGAVYGFLNMLIKLLQEETPTHMVVAFDFARKTFRNQIYADYKGTRKPTPPELKQSLSLLKQTLAQMNIYTVEQEGIEADDIIGALAKNSGFDCLILSGDRDVLQLVDENIKVMLTKKGISETQLVTAENIKELYSISPSQVIDLKALMGDSSDNIPGISGIGEKTALKLLEQYDTVENVLANTHEQKGALKERLENGKEIALISKQLATIKIDSVFPKVDFEKAKVEFPFGQYVYNVLNDLEFNSITKREAIFNNNIEKIVENEQQKIEEIEITDKLGFENFVKEVRKTKVFAFDLINSFSLAASTDKDFQIQIKHDLFSESFTNNQILDILKELFEDKQILKVTSNLKAHLHLLDSNDIGFKGEVFETTLADYLINAGEKRTAEIKRANQMIFAKQTLQEQLRELELEDLYQNIETPLIYVLFEMEKNGFKIDDKELSNLSKSLLNQLEELSNAVQAIAGKKFNLNSPKQLGEVLFEDLKLKAIGNKNNSTNIDVLNQLYDSHEIIPLIIRYRKLFKLSSTYVESYMDIVKKSGNIIHTVFNQTTTNTGRLSSSEPNLQNIPIKDDEGRQLRKLFVSKFEDGVIVSADYNQIELRLLAAFSEDETMLKAYKDGKDIHSLTASQIFGVPLESVTKEMRGQAKAVNFGIVYGISDYGLSFSLGSTRKGAKEYIEKYFEKYPGVKTYMEKNIESAKENGMIRTAFNRLRRIPEIKSARYALRQFGERVAMNMPLQGSASDIIKLAMIEVSKQLKQHKLKSQLILQIHDELIIDTLKAEEKQVKEILEKSMLNVVKLKVELIVAISSGKTWFDC
jgi:DNA polymerase-1